MATIKLSDEAPQVDEPIRFSFANHETFELGADSSKELDDAENRDFLTSVSQHPWLVVEPAIPEEAPTDVPQNEAAETGATVPDQSQDSYTTAPDLAQDTPVTERSEEFR